VPVAGWIVAGMVTATVMLHFSNGLLVSVAGSIAHEASRYAWHWYLCALVVGGITAWRCSVTDDAAMCVMLLTVASLLVVQAPLDARTRRLSRPVTYAAIAGTSTTTIASHAIHRDIADSVTVLSATMLVTTGFWVLHRSSPKSLGFGDVLLVVPLSLATASVSLFAVGVWQFVAATTGAVHALVIRHRRSTIPFGPHLIGAAWFVVVGSV